MARTTLRTYVPRPGPRVGPPPLALVESLDVRVPNRIKPWRPVVAAALLALASIAVSAEPANGDVAAVARDLVASATLVPPDDLDEAAARLLDAVDAAARAAGRGAPSFRKARRLDRAVRARFLREYRADADAIDGTLRDGTFNCLSGSLVYALAARAAGFEVRVLESPNHVFLELAFDDHTVFVETTTPNGFDLRVREARPVTGVPSVAGGAVWARSSAEPAGRLLLGYREIALAATPGLVHLNRAVRAADAGEDGAVAAHVAASAAHLDDVAQRHEEIAPLLGRAFRAAYEHGRFEDAWEIARVENRLFPWSTSGRDRLSAAAVKRTEAALEADRPDRAWALLDEADAILADRATAARLDLLLCPRIATAAARLGDDALARAAAERYAALEPDGLEADRLRAWVRHRIAAEAPPECTR